MLGLVRLFCGHLPVLVSVLVLLPAAASAEPRLRANPVASGPSILLGDLFTGVGSAADTPMARAPAPGQSVVFSASVLQARANMAGVPWRNTASVRQVVVQGGGEQSRLTDNVGEAQALTEADEIAVLARTVRRGEEISASDVIWIDRPINAPSAAVTEADNLIGMTAKRTIQAEQPIRPTDVEPTPAVRRGELVTLIYEAGGLRLAMRGRALANAAPGELVKVVNTQSNRTVEAIAESTGLARVMPAATSANVAVRPLANRLL